MSNSNQFKTVKNKIVIRKGRCLKLKIKLFINDRNKPFFSNIKKIDLNIRNGVIIKTAKTSSLLLLTFNTSLGENFRKIEANITIKSNIKNNSRKSKSVWKNALLKTLKLIEKKVANLMLLFCCFSIRKKGIARLNINVKTRLIGKIIIEVSLFRKKDINNAIWLMNK